MKKFLAMLLSLVLLVSTGVTALAAPEPTDEGLNNRLEAITLKVKETLGISDSFTSFKGSLNENDTASLWSLNWSKDDEQIHVSANENGTVVSFNDYVSGSNAPSEGKLPRFPAMTLEEAKSAAGAFLDKVLADSESVDLKGNSNLDYSGSAVFHMSGTMTLSGVDTPVNISISVSSSTKKVTSFYRSDSGLDYSGAAKPSQAGDQSAAAAALKGTLNMKLTYALSGGDTHTARLQYTPNPDGSYVVNAVTGQLLDLSALDYGNRPPVTDEKAQDMETTASTAAGLTEVEQTAVDKLKGVLSQSALEDIVRAFGELGLTSDFKVQHLNYYTYEDENKKTQVIAAIDFSATPEDGKAQYRYISMDAMTGKLLSVSSSRLYTEINETETAYPYTDTQAEATARSLANKILPEEMKQTALSEDHTAAAQDGMYYYTFYRTHAGILFPENYISVSINAQTGYVASLFYSWYDFDVTFISPDDIISADTAADKYEAAVGTVLKYVAVPQKTQESGLLLAYTGSNAQVWGVDASTGEILKSTGGTNEELVYDDIDGIYAEAMIRRLASYGVGFPGGAFKPTQELTQTDALVLIVSMNGRTFKPLTEPGAEDDIYDTAYYMGILTPDEKNPTKTVSRAEMMKYLVNGLGYGEIARLTDIFDSGFKDDASIPAALVGYVAIAKGLGIVSGYGDGTFRPNKVTTRVQAAIMVYNCLSR